MKLNSTKGLLYVNFLSALQGELVAAAHLPRVLDLEVGQPIPTMFFAFSGKVFGASIYDNPNPNPRMVCGVLRSEVTLADALDLATFFLNVFQFGDHSEKIATKFIETACNHRSRRRTPLNSKESLKEAFFGYSSTLNLVRIGLSPFPSQKTGMLEAAHLMLTSKRFPLHLYFPGG